MFSQVSVGSRGKGVYGRQDGRSFLVSLISLLLNVNIISIHLSGSNVAFVFAFSQLKMNPCNLGNGKIEKSPLRVFASSFES